MDQETINLIQENNRLIKENLELTRKNSKKIAKIRSHIRRFFIGKTIYWIVLILITAGAFYALKPIFVKASNSYKNLQQQIETTSQVIQNPGKMFKDINIANSLFGS